MKVVAILLLALAGFGLFQSSSARVTQISLELREDPKIAHDTPELALRLEDEFSERHEEHNELPETPPEVDRELPTERVSANGCIINIRSGLTDPQPVFLETGKATFYPFSDAGNMEVPVGQTMQMFCSGRFKSFDETLITATCESGQLFRVNGNSYKFSELVCKSWPDFVSRKTGSMCNGGTLIQVGFKVSPARFVQQMQICFNEEEEVTRYVHHTLQPGSNFYQTKVERINFQTNGFFGGKNVDRIYTQKTQMETINKDLGGEGHKYFNSSANVYLSRGHLGAKADLMFGSQQRATFQFINAAPQWQGFNAGNWARVEDGLRAWISKRKIHVECYTGVYGVTTLPHRDGHETPLYLARDANNNGLIPVPMLYFRVVIEPATKKGIVFIGVNNPHLTLDQIENDYIICNDISNKVNYIKWKRTDITAGYSYACEVSEFVAAVEHLPHLSANGGLLI